MEAAGSREREEIAGFGKDAPHFPLAEASGSSLGPPSRSYLVVVSRLRMLSTCAFTVPCCSVSLMMWRSNVSRSARASTHRVSRSARASTHRVSRSARASIRRASRSAWASARTSRISPRTALHLGAHFGSDGLHLATKSGRCGENQGGPIPTPMITSVFWLSLGRPILRGAWRRLRAPVLQTRISRLYGDDPSRTHVGNSTSRIASRVYDSCGSRNLSGRLGPFADSNVASTGPRAAFAGCPETCGWGRTGVRVNLRAFPRCSRAQRSPPSSGGEGGLNGEFALPF